MQARAYRNDYISFPQCVHYNSIFHLDSFNHTCYIHLEKTIALPNLNYLYYDNQKLNMLVHLHHLK